MIGFGLTAVVSWKSPDGHAAILYTMDDEKLK
jgi:hypothetical protein